MYFYKENGKQILDLKGTLIISHNSDLAKSRTSSAAPSKILNSQYVKLYGAGFFRKVFMSFYLFFYVWRKHEELTVDKTAFNKPS